MIFLSLIVVLMYVQWRGSGAPLQHDGWFLRWLEWLQSGTLMRQLPLLHMILAILTPAFVIAVLTSWVIYFLSDDALFFLYVPVLLYSLGRGNFSAEVKAYIAASQRGDTVIATKLSDELRGCTDAALADEEIEDWAALHAQTLRVISYRGFERMFAVLFWFFILGAVGAVVYRLSVIYRERVSTEDMPRYAAQWLWLIEWPAVRMMGLTWAMVGNFETCYRCWQARLLDVKNSSQAQLSAYLRGALGVEDSQFSTPRTADSDSPTITPNEPAYSLSLIKASLPLFSRSLLLWVCVSALITLLL